MYSCDSGTVWVLNTENFSVLDWTFKMRFSGGFDCFDPDLTLAKSVLSYRNYFSVFIFSEYYIQFYFERQFRNRSRSLRPSCYANYSHLTQLNFTV